MTNLTKPVKRESFAVVFESGKHRNIIVTVMPPGLLRFRAKGCKKSYDLTVDNCYHRAVKVEEASQRKKREKEKKLKAKKKGK